MFYFFYEDDETSVKFEMSEPYSMCQNMGRMTGGLTSTHESSAKVSVSTTTQVNIISTPAVYMNTKLKSL